MCICRHSAGALILDEVSTRVMAVVDELGNDAGTGFHGHENLGVAVGNSVLALRAGAVQIDGSTRGFGAGAGNTPLEVFAAVCDRLGVRTGLDVVRLLDVAEEIVRPVMTADCVKDRLSITMGYAGVYSSFLRHAYDAAQAYGVSGAAILLECGRRRLVGGQEDQIISIATELAMTDLKGQENSVTDLDRWATHLIDAEQSRTAQVRSPMLFPN